MKAGKDNTLQTHILNWLIPENHRNMRISYSGNKFRTLWQGTEIKTITGISLFWNWYKKRLSFSDSLFSEHFASVITTF